LKTICPYIILCGKVPTLKFFLCILAVEPVPAQSLSTSHQIVEPLGHPIKSLQVSPSSFVCGEHVALQVRQLARSAYLIVEWSKPFH
jgi:hypothetical protein